MPGATSRQACSIVGTSVVTRNPARARAAARIARDRRVAHDDRAAAAERTKNTDGFTEARNIGSATSPRSPGRESGCARPIWTMLLSPRRGSAPRPSARPSCRSCRSGTAGRSRRVRRPPASPVPRTASARASLRRRGAPAPLDFAAASARAAVADQHPDRLGVGEGCRPLALGEPRVDRHEHGAGLRGRPEEHREPGRKTVCGR